MLTRKKPLSRGSAMRSGAPKRAAKPSETENRDAQLDARAQRQLASHRATANLICTGSVVVQGSATSGHAVHKEDAATSEAYRRAVAAMVCSWCGIQGYSQHAHLNLGKGMGLKTDDRTGFPLCCTRPGVEGCHVAYDQYRLLPGGRDAHRDYGLEWGRITRDTILRGGLWPKNLPVWVD